MLLTTLGSGWRSTTPSAPTTAGFRSGARAPVHRNGQRSWRLPMRGGPWQVLGHSTAPHKPWPPFMRPPLRISTTSLSVAHSFNPPELATIWPLAAEAPLPTCSFPILRVTVAPGQPVAERHDGYGSAAPTNFAAQAISTSQIGLSWSVSSGATGYDVYELESGQAVLIGSLSSGATSFTVGNLSAGTTYSFEVAAFNSAGSSATGWVQATTSDSDCNRFGANRCECDRYIEHHRHISPGTRQLARRAISFTNGMVCRRCKWPVWVPTLPRQISAASPRAATEYFYVTAYNATSSASSGWVSVVMPAAPAVAPPPNLSASATSTSTGTLSWGASTGATGYAIYYWNGFRAVLLGTVSSGTTSVTIQGLAAGSTTYFAVVAYNNTSSAASNWVALTTPASSAATAADIFAQSITKTNARGRISATPREHVTSIRSN